MTAARKRPATKRRPTSAIPAWNDPIWYAREKLDAARATLATSREPNIRARLYAAVNEMHGLLDTDLPPPIAKALALFWMRLTWAEDTTGKGTLPATLKHISEDECYRLARKLYEIADDVTEHLLFLAREPAQ